MDEIIIPKCIAVKDKNNYLELQTKKVKSREEVLNDLNTVNNYWLIVQDKIKKDLNNSNYKFNNIEDWLEKLDGAIKLNQNFPSLEQTVALYQMKDLSGYHVMPQPTKHALPLLHYWGFGSPDLIAEIKRGGVVKEVKKKTINKKNENKFSKKEYKLIRIKQNGDFGTIVVDLKLRGMGVLDFCESVLTIQEFWRNFHLVSRVEKDKEKNDCLKNFNEVFKFFYNPNKLYTSNKRERLERVEMIGQVEIKERFPVYANTLATHLMFRQPGLLLPLTNEEQNASLNKKHDVLIEIIRNDAYNGNTNVIHVKISDLIFKEFFASFTNRFIKRENDFSNKFNLMNYFGGQYMVSENSGVMFDYEQNMIAIFESLSKIDEQDANSV